jgi:hypothetical protein
LFSSRLRAVSRASITGDIERIGREWIEHGHLNKVSRPAVRQALRARQRERQAEHNDDGRAKFSSWDVFTVDLAMGDLP